MREGDACLHWVTVTVYGLRGTHPHRDAPTGAAINYSNTQTLKSWKQNRNLTMQISGEFRISPWGGRQLSKRCANLLLPPATKVMFLHLCVILFTRGGGSVPACTTGHMTRGVFVRGSLCRGGLCPGSFLSGGSSSGGRMVSDQWGVCLGGSLCPGWVSVQGGFCLGGLRPGGECSLTRGVSVWGVSVKGRSLSRGVC